MKISTKRGKLLLGVGALAAVAAVSLGTARYAVGSDHADTTDATGKPAIDLTDLHIFPGRNNNNVVLALSVRPLITPAQGTSIGFDEDVLYQFKIDTDKDNREDLVIQARFEGKGANQKVFISGPIEPTRKGIVTQFEKRTENVGTTNRAFFADTDKKINVFAGTRADSFFLDLEQLGKILPDRLSALPKMGVKYDSVKEANTPRFGSFRKPGKDFFANLNLLAIVVEVPREMLADPKTKKVGQIGVWETASTRNK